MRSFIMLLLIVCAPLVAESNNAPAYWDGDRVTKSSKSREYSAALHNQFPELKPNYDENGQFYYSDTINSFGFKEVLNPQQEVVFCGPGDQNFSDAVKTAMSSTPQGCLNCVQDEAKSAVRDDASSVSAAPDAVVGAVRSVLGGSNANMNAKGRFCYKLSDPSVEYRQAGSETAVYCSAGQSMNYQDPISGFSCSLKLDVNLKEGETRYIRQLQSDGGVSFATIAQGFVGCYANPSSGEPQVSLINNPSSCSPSNRSTCIRTCDWADEVVCDPREMPRWGDGGMCGGYGTVLFKGDVREIDSSPQLSYSSVTRQLYSGKATMSCKMIGGKAKWVLLNSTCAATSSGN